MNSIKYSNNCRMLNLMLNTPLKIEHKIEMLALHSPTELFFCKQYN